MNVLPIKIVDSVEEAPNWARDFIDVRAAEIEQTIIVRNGTESGGSTVDIVFKDVEGNQFVAMTTGTIIQMLAAAIQGAENR